MTRLDGAVVLVLGASGGLGSLVADGLDARGATAVRSGRRPSSLEDAPLVADLRGEDAGRRLVTEVMKRHGRLDGVVAIGAEARNRSLRSWRPTSRATTRRPPAVHLRVARPD